jgi:hypothetical protein
VIETEIQAELDSIAEREFRGSFLQRKGAMTGIPTPKRVALKGKILIFN